MPKQRYWNQDRFEDLEQVAQIAEHQGLPGFAEHCRLRARGLRKQALDILKVFIDKQYARSPEQARAVAVRIMTLQHDHPKAMLITHPLWEGFLRSVLEDWRNESESTIPRRWLALHTDNPAMMQEVLDRDPSDVPVRIALVRQLLSTVEYATHHLVEGIFLGQAEEVMSQLEETSRHLQVIPETPARGELEQTHEDLLRLTNDWQEFSQSGNSDFRHWCEARGRRHNWWRIVYYEG
jgi:hypothetical protein